jgi:DNA-binding response OmpR family regulator
MARVLLVEDDGDVRFGIEQILLSAGHKVEAADTMTRALGLLHRGSFDLVLVDAKLPDGTGFEVADHAVESSIKALMMSGYAFTLPSSATQQHPILQKPFRPIELIAAIEARLQEP